MPVTTRYEKVTADDGGEFDAFCAVPPTGSGPGVLVFQEIFGINDNMRDLATRLADAGYVAVVPDMFWRVEPRFERKDETGFADAIAVVQKFDWDTGVHDVQATHAQLLGMGECTGKIGAIGFCLGGGLAFATAARSRVDGKGPDAAVCYYGSAINGMLTETDEIDCPLMLHYGENDPFIPAEQIDEVEAVTATIGAEFHRYPAGHAFANNDAPSMYDADSAALAWERTLDFFARHLA